MYLSFLHYFSPLICFYAYYSLLNTLALEQNLITVISQRHFDENLSKENQSVLLRNFLLLDAELESLIPSRIVYNLHPWLWALALSGSWTENIHL